MRPDELSDRIIDFAGRIGKLADALPDTRMGRHVAGQIVRSGTSPAPNYEEARSAESRRDFVHKLGICLKELRETRCWIRIIAKSELLPKAELEKVADECEQLMNIIGKSIVTAKQTTTRKQRPN